MKNKEFNVRMSVSLTADPKLVSRTKLNPLKLAKSTATEPQGYLHFCRTNMYVFTPTQYCIEKAMSFFFYSTTTIMSIYHFIFQNLPLTSQCVVDVVDVFCWYEVDMCMMEEIFVIPPPELH